MSGEEWEVQVKTRNLVSYLTERIMDENFQEFVNGLPPELIPYCDDPEACFLKHYVFEGKCQGFCYVHHPLDYPNKEWLIVPKSCIEQEFCCIREYSYCVDRETGLPRKSVSIFYNPQVECNNERLEVSVCPPGEHVTTSGTCFDNCAH